MLERGSRARRNTDDEWMNERGIIDVEDMIVNGDGWEDDPEGLEKAKEDGSDFIYAIRDTAFAPCVFSSPSLELTI